MTPFNGAWGLTTKCALRPLIRSAPRKCGGNAARSGAFAQRLTSLVFRLAI